MFSETGLVLREDSTESLDLHREVRQGLCEEETLRISKVGNGGVLQAERTACVPALRQEDSEQKASQCDWNIGNKVWVMPSRG